jgi:hypothetical protein
MCLQEFTTLTLLLEGDKLGSIITDLKFLSQSGSSDKHSNTKMFKQGIQYQKLIISTLLCHQVLLLYTVKSFWSFYNMMCNNVTLLVSDICNRCRNAQMVKVNTSNFQVCTICGF